MTVRLTTAVLLVLCALLACQPTGDIVLEQTIAFTGGRVVSLGGRQTEFHIIE